MLVQVLVDSSIISYLLGLLGFEITNVPFKLFYRCEFFIVVLPHLD